MNENKLEVIITIVNNYLKERKYSTREFAGKCGLSRSWMSDLVNHKKKRMISYGQMELLAKGLSMDIEVFTRMVNASSEDASNNIQTVSHTLINKIQSNEKLLSALKKICEDKQLTNVVIQISSMDKKDLQVILPVIETISKSK